MATEEHTPAARARPHGLRLKTRDLTGERFGRWKVVAFSHYEQRANSSRARWRVRCDCGQERTVVGGQLTGGHSLSCGCARSETLSKKWTTHGHTRVGDRAPEYGVWSAVKRRCDNPKDSFYDDYGARGIGMCAGWHGDYAAFIADMGRRPDARHSIDRVDNKGGYWCGHCSECVALGRPMNCRWATPMEQAHNKRNNRMLTFGGRTWCAAEWGAFLGWDANTILFRINAGWSVERALTVVPKRPNWRSSKRTRRPMLDESSEQTPIVPMRDPEPIGSKESPTRASSARR